MRLDLLPEGTVLAAYAPDLQAALGHKPGTFWSWRKEDGRWVGVGGAQCSTGGVAASPNLTIVYQPGHVGTIPPDMLAEMDAHTRQAREAVEQ